MNEDQITALLERLGRDIEVSNAPVVPVTEDGRRRLRWRHRAQVGGAAAVVLAIAGGGLVLQQQLATDGETTNQSPAVTPSGAELVGSWKPIMLAGNPTPPEDRTAKPISFAIARGTGQLTWSGNNGCNLVGGSVQLGQGGAFHASVRFMTQMACLGVHGTLRFSGVSAVKNARHLEISSGRLQLTSASGTLLGVFARSRVTITPTVDPPVGLPGQVPTKAKLAAVGEWTGPIGRVAAVLGHEIRQTTVTFEYNDLNDPTNAKQLTWIGYDGCNSAAGIVHISSSGRFSITGGGETLRGCSNPTQAVTAVTLVEAATQVRLLGRQLQFYDDAGVLLGILRPYPVLTY